MRLSRALCAVSLSTLLLISVQPAAAQYRNSAQDGPWTSPSTWDPAGLPTWERVQIYHNITLTGSGSAGDVDLWNMTQTVGTLAMTGGSLTCDMVHLNGMGTDLDMVGSRIVGSAGSGGLYIGNDCMGSSRMRIRGVSSADIRGVDVTSDDGSALEVFGNSELLCRDGNEWQGITIGLSNYWDYSLNEFVPSVGHFDIGTTTGDETVVSAGAYYIGSSDGYGTMHVHSGTVSAISPEEPQGLHDGMYVLGYAGGTGFVTQTGGTIFGRGVIIYNGQWNAHLTQLTEGIHLYGGTFSSASTSGELHNLGGTIAIGDSSSQTCTIGSGGDFIQDSGVIDMTMGATTVFFNPSASHDMISVTNGDVSLTGGTVRAQLGQANGLTFRPEHYGDWWKVIDHTGTGTTTLGDVNLVDNLDYDRGSAAFDLQAINGDIFLMFIGATAGDANFDNCVDVGDLGILAFNWQSTGMTWAKADFTGDGVVDVGDLGVLAAHWGWTINDIAVPVPEPASLAMLAMGGFALLRRRR